MSFKNILVPYDGSEPANRAFRAALDIAKRDQAKLKVITFIGEADVGAWYEDLKLDYEALKKFKDSASKLLDGLKEMAKKEDVHIASDIIEADSVVKKIISFVKEKKIDLVIMGSSGKGKFDRIMLGSVSRGVSEHSPCPVMIIK